MADRKGLPKSIRFEVFKRDRFTCQYCGAKSPDVVLHVDHIEPVSKGGTDDLLNLLTSCSDCNLGKSDRRISDDSAIERKRQQLEILEDRREQIELMFQWNNELLEQEERTLAGLEEAWERRSRRGWTEQGRQKIRSLLSKYTVEEVLEAITIACDQYLRFYTNGDSTQDSAEEAFGKIGGICFGKRREKSDPTSARAYYIRGIIRNRLHYYDARVAIDLIRAAIEAGNSAEDLERLAKEVPSWSEWRRCMEMWIRGE